MKKALLLTAALLALTTGVAMAVGTDPGVNLSWADCNAQFGTGLNQTAICTSNTTSAKNLYGTYCLPVGGTQSGLVGNDIAMDITVPAGLPCWWNFTVAPRNAGYGMNYGAVCADAGAAGIFDYWGTIAGGPSGGVTAIPLSPPGGCPGCARVRIIGTVAIDASAAVPVPDAVEIYSFTFQLKYNATVGACTGCTTAACFNLINLQVTQTANIPIQLFSPSSRQFATYAGGALIVGGGCNAAVPTTNKTWGSVKALYR